MEHRSGGVRASFAPVFQGKSRRKTVQKLARKVLGCPSQNFQKSPRKMGLYHIFGTKFACKSKKHLLFADFSLKAKKG